MTEKELLAICKEHILQYGTLRYCTGGLCACMGCVNGKLTRLQRDMAMQLPQVKAWLEDPNSILEEKRNEGSLQWRLQRFKENKKRGTII